MIIFVKIDISGKELFVFFIIISIVQIFYWAIFFGRFAFARSSAHPSISLHNEAVSIIICSRNEAANLVKNLPKVLNQNYLNFELILVDDASTDNTEEIIKELEEKYAYFKYYKIQNKHKKGKKAALKAGIELAKNDWILLTDADCEPDSDDWISEMMSARKIDTEIVLGYGPYRSGNNFLNKWIVFETCYTAIQYFSAAIWRIPYMGVGRNLLYHKSVFEKHKSVFDDNLISGDDDLFINAAANSKNTEICLSKKSFVYSEPKRSFKELFNQKNRHYSSSTSYKLKHQLILGLLSFSHFSFWLMLPVIFYLNTDLLIVLFFLRLFVLVIIWNRILSIFDERKLLGFVLLSDLLLVFYFLIFLPSLFVKTSIWK